MQEEIKQEEVKFAVLIDADNVSNKYIKIILDEISNYGIATYKRIYGDWTDTHLSSWKPVLLDNSIIPIQQYSYTTGKNSTDSAMIIDAMDILYSRNVQGFCIVSSDSDFTRLVARLRESGMNVIGMGESKTPKAFIAACNQFKYLDILLANAKKAEKKAAARDTKPAKGETALGTSGSVPAAEAAEAGAAPETGKGKKGAKGSEKEPEKTAAQTKEKDREKESKSRGRGRGGAQQEAKSKEEMKAGARPERETEKEKAAAREQERELEKERELERERELEKEREQEKASERLPEPEKEREPEKAASELPEESAPQPRTNLEMVRQAIHSIIEDGSDEDGWMLSADLGNHLAKRFPDFDVRNFGFSKLTPFLASLRDFEIKRARSAGNRSVLVYVRNR